MKTIRKKTVSLVLAALMLISVMPFAAFADETEAEADTQATPVVVDGDTNTGDTNTYNESGSSNNDAAYQDMTSDGVTISAQIQVTEGSNTLVSTSAGKRMNVNSLFSYDGDETDKANFNIAKKALSASGLKNSNMYTIVSASVTDGVLTVEVSAKDHDCSKYLKYVDNGDDDFHTLECSVCGQTYNTEAHFYKVSSKNADYHEEKCSKCGHVKTINHATKDFYKTIGSDVKANTEITGEGDETIIVVTAAKDATCTKKASYAKIKYKDCGTTVGGEEYGVLADHIYDSNDKCVNCGKAKDDETEYAVNIYLTRERSTPLVSGTAKLTKSDMNNLKTNADGAASVLGKTKGSTSEEQDIIDAYRKSIKDYFATMDVVGSVNIYVSEDISKTIGNANAKVEITILGALVSNDDGYLVEDETGYTRELYLGKSYFDQVKLTDPTGKRTLVNLKITKSDGSTRIISKSNTTAAIKVQSDDVECKAIWSAKSVTVKFYRHPGSSDLLATITMRAGELIDNLPKLDGESTTWYLEDGTMLQEGKVYYDFSKDTLKAYPNSNNDVYLFVYKNGDTNTPVDSNPTVVTGKVQSNGVIDRSELTTTIEKVMGKKNLKIVGLFDGKGWTEYTTNNKSTKYASSAVYVGTSAERQGPQFLYVMVNPDGTGSGSSSKADSSNPKTGDNAMLGTAAAVMTAAVLGLGATAVVRKKKEI